MHTIESIRQKVSNMPSGKPFATSNFLNMGKRAAVDKALSRLVSKGEVTSVARGIFVRAERGRYTSTVMPNPIEVAQVIAKKTGSTIQVHGATALNQLSLSTQVPAQLIFYTSGPNS